MNNFDKYLLPSALPIVTGFVSTLSTYHALGIGYQDFEPLKYITTSGRIFLRFFLSLSDLHFRLDSFYWVQLIAICILSVFAFCFKWIKVAPNVISYLSITLTTISVAHAMCMCISFVEIKGNYFLPITSTEANYKKIATNDKNHLNQRNEYISNFFRTKTELIQSSSRPSTANRQKNFKLHALFSSYAQLISLYVLLLLVTYFLLVKILMNCCVGDSNKAKIKILQYVTMVALATMLSFVHGRTSDTDRFEFVSLTYQDSKASTIRAFIVGNGDFITLYNRQKLEFLILPKEKIISISILANVSILDDCSDTKPTYEPCENYQ